MEWYAETVFFSIEFSSSFLFSKFGAGKQIVSTAMDCRDGGGVVYNSPSCMTVASVGVLSKDTRRDI